VFAHAGLVIGLDLSQLGFLIGGQNLHDFGLDAGVFDLEFDQGLRILCGEGARLSFVEWTAGLKSFHGAVVLAHLLHQRLQGWFFFFPDGLDLAVLIAGQIELLVHAMEVAVGAAVAVHTLSNRRW
jgi:hypothetical protein